MLKLLIYSSNGWALPPAAFRRLCVETVLVRVFDTLIDPAAFRRLCVETPCRCPCLPVVFQPPSGGCVLKLPIQQKLEMLLGQPPSGGCVLKLITVKFTLMIGCQPPSGGCVLKQIVRAI